jgi:hypothetical protein
MPTPWLKRIRKTGKLKVLNKAATWASSVEAAMKTFNKLSFGVELVAEKEEKAADIVVVLANGPTQHTHYGDTVQTSPDFKFDELHGETRTLADQKLNAIFFAGVFLPGKVKKATAGQKEMIVVHEFIHACGLNDAHDHDSVGIMFAQMMEDHGGLIEYLHDKGAKPMPPIRVGPKTMCKMKMLWSGGETCKDDGAADEKELKEKTDKAARSVE